MIASRKWLCLVGLVLSAASVCQGQVATLRLGRGAPATGAPAKVLPCEGAEGVLQFDLSALPKDAEVRRAELVVSRSKELPADDPQRMEWLWIKIVPLFGEFKPGEAPPGGVEALRLLSQPLLPAGPWFDRFDATSAVRAWSKGKPGSAFLVKSFPQWDKRAVHLDVMFDGQPKDPPAQVSGLKVLHRSGQTFITWKEIADPAAGKTEIRWGQMQKLLAELDRQREVRYCVYRGRKPISAETLVEAELVAQVKPLSCWNVNGRNEVRARDEVAAKLMAGEKEGKVQFWVEGDQGAPEECPIDRFVIDAGPDGKTPGEALPPGTGLYVHTVDSPRREAGVAESEAPNPPLPRGAIEEAYYAVVTMIDGVQNTVDFSPENALAKPVAEKPGTPAPVVQRKLPPRPVWDYRHGRYHVVQWTAPPLSNLPSQYYNWLVCVPEKGNGGDRHRISQTARNTASVPLPLELNLPEPGSSYYRAPFCIEAESIIAVPHDFPMNTWYYGYHESEGTLKSLGQGTVQNYTQRRMVAFVDWVASVWPVDRGRINVAGNGLVAGSGALNLGLRQHKVFNLVMTSNACPDFRGAILKFRELGPERKVPNVERRFRVKCPEEEIQKLVGPLDKDLKTDSGGSVWDELDLTRLVKGLPAATDLPVVTTSSQGGFEYDRDFRLAMLDKGHLLIADFNVYGNSFLIPVSMTGALTGMVQVDVRKDLSYPAFRGPDAGMLLKPPELATGELVVSDGTFQWWGRFNVNCRWSDVVDKPDRYEITLVWSGRGTGAADVTLRRLQAFKPAAGKTCSWQFKAGEGEKAVQQQGEVTVGDDGLIRIPQVPIGNAPGRLVVTPKS